MAEKQGNLLKLKREFKTKNKKKQQGLFCIIHYTKQKSEKEVRLLTEVSFKKIKESAEIRQSKGNVNEKLNENCNNIPKEFQKDGHGTHRGAIKILPTQPLSYSVRMIQMKLDQVIPRDGNLRDPVTTSS